MKIVLASRQRQETQELDAILSPLGWGAGPAGELDIPEADEPHVTSRRKCASRRRGMPPASGMPALADDSGLWSRAGRCARRSVGPLRREPKSDTRNNEKLLATLASPDSRAAHFVSVIVFVRHADDPQPLIAEGEWYEGEIITEHRGASGFGYDPLCSSYRSSARRLRSSIPPSRTAFPIARRRCNHCSPACAADPPRWPASFRIAPAGSRRTAGKLEFRSQPPLSLYIHIPWWYRSAPTATSTRTRRKARFPRAITSRH